MNSTACQIDLIRGNDVTAAQEQFINHWNQHYFGEVAVAKEDWQKRRYIGGCSCAMPTAC